MTGANDNGVKLLRHHRPGSMASPIGDGLPGVMEKLQRWNTFIGLLPKPGLKADVQDAVVQ